jgi:glycosyltransferase involved in cell wall biosynthesis
MNFLIVTHVVHTQSNNKYYGYAPYINEMNIWIKNVDKLTIIAPLKDYQITAIHEHYQHDNIEFISVPEFSFITPKKSIQALFSIPIIIFKLFIQFSKANHIHLRCPGNMGLLGSFVQIFFPFKKKSAKYAGNWDEKSNQPLSYKMQRSILSNTFFTKNIQVLVYGNWNNLSKNCKPFFTATYKKSEIERFTAKSLTDTIRFVFVGTLSKGKQPQYAIEIVQNLMHQGINCQLDLYGNGAKKNNLEHYINTHNLQNSVFLKGVSNREEMKSIYQKSHFLLLPSKSEGWPKVVAEAMFWGCLPAVTAVSCVPYMLDYGNRGIILTNNLADDSKAIIDVIKNPDAYANQLIEAYNWSVEFTIDKFEDEIKKIVKAEHD